MHVHSPDDSPAPVKRRRTFSCTFSIWFILLAMALVFFAGVVGGLSYASQHRPELPSYYEVVAAYPGGTSFTLYCTEAAAQAGQVQAQKEHATVTSIIQTNRPITDKHGRIKMASGGSVCHVSP